MTDPILSLDWAFVFDNLHIFIAGTAMTIALTVASLLVGFFVGFPVSAIEVYTSGLLKSFVRRCGVLFRGTPAIIILVTIFFVFNVASPFVAAVIGLGLRSAAYQSQIYRGALESVSEGQMEAARSVGMTRLQAIKEVIVPQALRRSIPGFQNEMTIVLKDTSIAFVIGLTELLTRAHDLFVQQTSAVLEVIFFISAIYFVLTFTSNRALDKLGDYYAIPEGENT